MKIRRLDINHARAQVKRLYPRTVTIQIVEGFLPRKGWVPIGEGVGLFQLPALKRRGYTNLGLRLFDAAGFEIGCPDYQMEEFETEVDYRMEVGRSVKADINQGDRIGSVLAVVNDEALVEFEMPGGSTFLWIVDARYPDVRKDGTVWSGGPQRGLVPGQ